MPPAALLSLTHQLALRAAELRGHPMLFELASAATELLPVCLADPPPLPPGWDGYPSSVAAAMEEASSACSSTADLAELAQQAVREGDAAPHQQRRQHGRDQQPSRAGRPRGRPQLNLEAESRRLREHQAQLEQGAAHAAMRAVRAKLPAAGQRQEVVALVASRRVVVISGATGCGKSTQVGGARGCLLLA